ncbi:MAG: S8 family serine peptidase [Prevotella sp.]|nr:S8 family serine peptidase [Candidatus Equicola stercoris]
MRCKNRYFSIVLLLSMFLITTHADTYAEHNRVKVRITKKHLPSKHIIAFVKMDTSTEVSTGINGKDVLTDMGCKVLADWSDLFIADIPMQKLDYLAAHRNVVSIEAGEPFSLCLDTTAILLHSDKVWKGENVQQAFTGKDVVVGIQDIGFDFTHPTFSGNDRIKTFWDMLSKDTIGSSMPVGRTYNNEELMALQHSYDGLQETHGTHTAGLATGNGYTSPYRGMAWESDIVLVANACSNNSNLIDSADIYKYTDALDVLGFKYIFDYAESQGKPCVISFSEGSPQDMYNKNLLYEALERITGPGRILMASAGNSGMKKGIIHKSKGQESTKAHFTKTGKTILFFVCADGHINNKLQWAENDITFTTSQIIECKDSLLCDTVNGTPIQIALYPSCFDKKKNVYEINITTDEIDLEVFGKEVEVDVFPYSGNMDGDATEYGYTINSPAAAPSVIAVGNSAYRQGIKNYKGEWKTFDKGSHGIREENSSLGPSLTGLTKPDIMAPGTNVISSYSSFYLENNPDAQDINWDVEHFKYADRIYAWNANSGTSMSCPVAAGIVALWLQAKPTLTKDDILDVFKHTAQHYTDTISYPNCEYGYGEIDAYAGLLYILGASNIISRHQIDNSIFPLRENESMYIYTTDGKHVQEMQSGQVYIIQVNSADASRNGSMLIRR